MMSRFTPIARLATHALIASLSVFCLAGSSTAQELQEETFANGTAASAALMPAPAATTTMTGNTANAPQESDKIRFSYADAEWMEVIETFASETGFSLRPIAQPPSGTFRYTDNSEYTPMEALDLINKHLSLEGYTLIRYRNSLILRELGTLPEDLIETVTPEELYQRGKFEYLRCRFELDETGDKLRLINELRIKARRPKTMHTYRMKFVDTESLLLIVRDMMRLNEYNEDEDQQFKITVEPLGDRLFINATDEKYETFLGIAGQVDVDSDVAIEDGQKTQVYLRKYAIYETPELTMQVLQSVMQGRDVNLEQDAESGTIVLCGAEADHVLAEKSLADLAAGESAGNWDFNETASRTRQSKPP